MNKLKPGIIGKINTNGGDYKMMDNLSQFQKGCVKYGLADVDLFQTTDLWDYKNIALVTQTIFAVGRAVSNNYFWASSFLFKQYLQCYRHPEFRGPFLGPKPSECNVREFSEETIAAGKNIINY